ncbi:MAG: 2-oxoacid:acceptor oxidoreductase family protein [Spirochaetia bacterium]|jgi:2-oxoglutarate ferredoxin oxidoreductase subunit gamma|nr:2-oxoacid:acceptor oxidoreductase family protein [Spirochaetia bacterium]
MHERIIIAGFGGQGVIMAGKLLCIAAMNEKKYVSHIPSYGAEMRGGTANCSVVISDKEIGSPTVPKPTIVVVLNTPSLTKFEPIVQPGGLLIYNSSLIDRKPERTDITVIDLKANDISEAEGSTRAANMAAIGKLIALKPDIASLDSVIKALEVAISARNRKHNDVNIKVLTAAYNQ